MTVVQVGVTPASPPSEDLVVNDGAVGKSRPYAGEILLHDENVEAVPADASIVPDQVVYKIVREDGTGQLVTGKVCGAGICVKFTGIAWMIDNAPDLWLPNPNDENIPEDFDYTIEWTYSDGSTSLFVYTGATVPAASWVPFWGQHIGGHLAARGSTCVTHTFAQAGSGADNGTLPTAADLEPSLVALEGRARYLMGVCCPGVIPVSGTILSSSRPSDVGRTTTVLSQQFTAEYTADIDCDTGLVSNIVNSDGDPVPTLPTECMEPC